MDCHVGTKVPPRNDKTRHAGLDKTSSRAMRCLRACLPCADPASHSCHDYRLRVTEVNPSSTMTEKHLLTYLPTNLLTPKSTPHPVFRFSADAQNRKQTSPSRGEGKRVAFTLAEVLITLGIIGIVAAMTMPTVITKHQKKVTATKLKQTYSIIAQALEISKAEYGDVSNWNSHLEFKTPIENIDRKEFLTNFAQKYLIPNLKSVKDYGYINARIKLGYTGSSWTSYYFGLPNGSLTEITFSNSCLKYENKVCVEGVYLHLLLTIDVNGVKSPNKIGRDIFNTMFVDGKYQMYVYGPDSLRTDRTALLEHCRSAGYSCGLLIQMDGWEIKDDYPW